MCLLSLLTATHISRQALVKDRSQQTTVNNAIVTTKRTSQVNNYNSLRLVVLCKCQRRDSKFSWPPQRASSERVVHLLGVVSFIWAWSQLYSAYPAMIHRSQDTQPSSSGQTDLADTQHSRVSYHPSLLLILATKNRSCKSFSVASTNIFP